MFIKKLNKLLGVILAITLPVGVICFFAFYATSSHFFTSKRWYNNSSSADGGKALLKELSDIHTISIDVDAINLEIFPSRDDKVHIEFPEQQQIKINENNGSLSIKFKHENFLLPSIHGTRMLTMKIAIPSNVNEVSANFGASGVQIEHLCLNNLSIDNGVGTVLIQGIEVSNKASITNGVGTTDIKESTIQSLSIENGIGEVSYIGGTTHFMSVKNGIGDLALAQLQINELSIESGIGTVSIDHSIVEILETATNISHVEISNSEIKNRR